MFSSNAHHENFDALRAQYAVALTEVRDDLKWLDLLIGALQEGTADWQGISATRILACAFGIGRHLGRLEVQTRMPSHDTIGILASAVTGLSMEIASAVGQNNFRHQVEGFRRAQEKIPDILARVDELIRENN